MKKVLVTGSNGLLGQKITEAMLANNQVELVATSKGANRFGQTAGYIYEPLDVLDGQAVLAMLEKHRPDAVIHTAAMTNVDACHVNQEDAWHLNVDAVSYLLNACQMLDIHFVHLSTDFVFDGLNGPYKEEDPLCPLSYYGKTKAAAEALVQKATCKWAIVRTILVYGIIKDMSRSNIVLWAKNALEKGQPIKVVNDQYRMPTLAEDLATACFQIARQQAAGIFHICGKDELSIAEIVKKIAQFWELDYGLVTEVDSSTLNQEAKRPLKTGFLLNRAINVLGYAPRSFTQGLQLVNQQLLTIKQK